jgi:hypothetical protein
MKTYSQLLKDIFLSHKIKPQEIIEFLVDECGQCSQAVEVFLSNSEMPYEDRDAAADELLALFALNIGGRIYDRFPLMKPIYIVEIRDIATEVANNYSLIFDITVIANRITGQLSGKPCFTAELGLTPIPEQLN